MWHAVSAEPKAQVLIGLKPGVDKRKFCEALDNGQVEEMFQKHAVHAGDTFFIRAGTPHTIGPGMIICEVQEYSDLTYRVYDYGRVDPDGKPRELHVQKALEVINFGASSAPKTRPLPLAGKTPERMLVAACRYFAAEQWEISQSIEAESEPRCFDLLTVLGGQGKFEWQGGASNYQSGECWFTPATLPRISIHPTERTTLMRAYVPDLSALRSSLKTEGASAEAISHAVFD
jgi:mannose-6-phosphate isomerase